MARPCVRTAEGRIEIGVAGPVDVNLERVIYAAVPETEHGRIVPMRLQTYRVAVRSRLSPAERGETFKVPRLMTEIQGQLAFADTDVFMESHDWSLLNHPARLDEHEFTIRETAHGFEIDLDGNRLTYRFAGEQEQLSLNVHVEGWTQEALVLWLDKQVRQPDVGQAELVKWLSGLATYLINSRGLHVSALMRCKFILARKIRDKLDAIRLKERNSVYQSRLFGAGAKPEVSFETTFVFRDGMYQGERRYCGRWQPTKHFLGTHAVPAFDGADDGEEIQCARTLDGLPQVKFWVRNVARHRDSFWLPTATDKFIPILWRNSKMAACWSSNTKARILPTVPTLRRSGQSANCGNAQATARGYSSLLRKASMGGICDNSCWTAWGRWQRLKE